MEIINAMSYYTITLNFSWWTYQWNRLHTNNCTNEYFHFLGHKHRAVHRWLHLFDKSVAFPRSNCQWKSHHAVMSFPMDNVCIQFGWNWTDIVLADIFGKMALSYFEIFVLHVIEREPSYPVDIVLKWFINIIEVEIFNEFATMLSHLNAFKML